jgi:hypothetical protein
MRDPTDLGWPPPPAVPAFVRSWYSVQSRLKIGFVVVAEVEDVGALDVELEAVLVMSPTLMLEYPLGVLVSFS